MTTVKPFFFVTEKPNDENGNRGHGIPQVLKVQKLDDTFGSAKLKVLEPNNFSWGTVLARNFVKVDGPVREFKDENEYVTAIQKAKNEGEDIADWQLEAARLRAAVSTPRNGSSSR